MEAQKKIPKKKTRKTRKTKPKTSQAIQAPIAKTVLVRLPNPTMRANTDGSVTISKREMAFSVETSKTFKVQAFNLFPGGFPAWIQGPASSWSKWKWLSLKFDYIPTCSTSTPGLFAMGYIYDFKDTVPTSEQAFSGLFHYAAGPYWAGADNPKLEAVFDPNRSSLKNYPYITPNQLEQVFAKEPGMCNDFVPGRLLFSCSGGPDTAIAAGRVFVTYKIQLIEPCPQQVDAAPKAVTPVTLFDGSVLPN